MSENRFIQAVQFFSSGSTDFIGCSSGFIEGLFDGVTVLKETVREATDCEGTDSDATVGWTPRRP